jgi:hypothetical protein
MMREVPVSLLLQFQRKNVDSFEIWCEENNPSLEEMKAEMDRRLGKEATSDD